MKPTALALRTRLEGRPALQELTAAKSIELRAFDPAHAERTLAVDDVLWMARIVWASQ